MRTDGRQRAIEIKKQSDQPASGQSRRNFIPAGE
jgi:hypothetical protein